MSRIFYPLLFSVILSACTRECPEREDAFNGKWIIKGSTGVGPAQTLHFKNINGVDILSFDCSGSPGPNWPSVANTEYKYENGKLVYKDYSGGSGEFRTITSFAWVKEGEEFSLKFYQLLNYISADYTVSYVRVE